MNKSELLKQIAEKTNLSLAQVEAACTAIFATIQSTLEEKGKIKIPEFGTFSIKERKARNGRNPSNGETLEIAAATIPVFKPSAELKNAVNVGKK